MSKKQLKEIETNQEPNDNQEPEIQIPGWADFIRRELKYSEAKTNNYHQVLTLGAIADALTRLATCEEYRVKIMETERMGREMRGE